MKFVSLSTMAAICACVIGVRAQSESRPSSSNRPAPSAQPISAPPISSPVQDALSGSGTPGGSMGTGRKARYDDRKFSKYEAAEAIKKEPNQFMSSKNLIRTVVKLFFGNDEESAATSRQILNILVSLLDMLKNTFGQRARASESRGLRDAMDDAASAGASMLKGYVRSVLAKDRQCVQRHLCEASKEAVKDGREIGYLIAQFGGYAASYALDGQKSQLFQNNYDATRKGRSGEDCQTSYQACNEA